MALNQKVLYWVLYSNLTEASQREALLSIVFTKLARYCPLVFSDGWQNVWAESVGLSASRALTRPCTATRVTSSSLGTALELSVSERGRVAGQEDPRHKVTFICSLYLLPMIAVPIIASAHLLPSIACVCLLYLSGPAHTYLAPQKTRHYACYHHWRHGCDHVHYAPRSSVCWSRNMKTSPPSVMILDSANLAKALMI